MIAAGLSRSGAVEVARLVVLADDVVVVRVAVDGYRRVRTTGRYRLRGRLPARMAASVRAGSALVWLRARAPCRLASRPS